MDLFTSPDQPDAGRPLADRMRPAALDQLIGQDHLTGPGSLLEQAIVNDRVFSILLWGPPGCGKTTLAGIIAGTTAGAFIRISAVLSGVKDIRKVIDTAREQKRLFDKRTILFVDEIHRMPISVEEVLYPAMEDFKLDLVIGQGPGARTVKIDLEPFTLVGATTRIGLLSSPLRDRFGVICRLEFYTPQELAIIVTRTARILGVEIPQDGAVEIGRRSRGTPRIANRLLRRVRDFATVKGGKAVDAELASDALGMMDVDESGLDQMDRKLLSVLIEHYGGGPVGAKTLAVACSEDVKTIEDIYEPYLIQCGFIKRTHRGRVATAKAYRHLNFLA